MAVVFGVALIGFLAVIWWLAGHGPESGPGFEGEMEDRIEALAARYGTSKVTRDDPIRKVDGVFVRTWRVVMPDVDAVESFVADLTEEVVARQAAFEPVEPEPGDAARVRIDVGVEAFDLHLEIDASRVAVVTLQPTPSPSPAPTPTVRPTLPADARGRLAILLDDAGQTTDLVARATGLPDEVGIAVLPFLPKSSETASAFDRAGHEVWLHLPMEANGGENPGPGAVKVDMTPTEVRIAVHSALTSVPHAVGVNNHMGSRATADLRTMTWVMQELSVRDVAFLDSRTTIRTVAEDAARAQGVPTGRRHVFLDNERTRAAVMTQLEEAVYRARADGQAIAIGHLNPVTVGVLEDQLPGLSRRGVDLVRPSALMQ